MHYNVRKKEAMWAFSLENAEKNVVFLFDAGFNCKAAAMLRVQNDPH